MNRGFSTRERAVDSRGSVLLRLDSPAQLFEQILDEPVERHMTETVVTASVVPATCTTR